MRRTVGRYSALSTLIGILSILALTCTATTSAYAQEKTEQSTVTDDHRLDIGQDDDTAPKGWWDGLTKEKKMLVANTSAISFITLWGLAQWDYGTSGMYFKNEQWFGERTKYGGADKLGHFWSTYALADSLTGLYENFGYTSRKANLYGFLSAWSLQAIMEIEDGTSETQGFSYEDMILNTLGGLTSILMERYPELDRKIDFRVEYEFNVTPQGIFDDYSNLNYSVVLKLDGFDSMNDSLLRYLEFHLGYYSRGYDSSDIDQQRAIYSGIGINLSKLFDARGYKKTAKCLEYIQIPYTNLKARHSLD